MAALLTGPVLAGLSIAIGGIGALATYRQGQAASMVEDAKADQAVLQGRVQAANYKAEASQKLKNLEKVLAANTARASAGNISPFTSGDTPALIARLNTREGVNQFTISRDNATMAVKMAKYTADQHRTAAKNIMQSAKTQAFIKLGESAVTAGQIYPMDSFTNPGNYTMFNNMAPGGM